jgi:hypothetical protein
VRLRVTLVTGIAVACAAVGLLAGQGTTLRYKWAAGQDDRYRLSQKITATVSGIPGGGSQTIEQSLTQVMRMQVTAVAADGTATIKQTFESVRMEMATPNGMVVIDTDAKEKPSEPAAVAPFTTLTAMVGEAVTLTMRANGEVQNVEGMTRIFDKISAGLPAGGAADPTFASMKAGLNDEAMRQMFSQSLASFPDRPIAPGESWTATVEIPQPMLGRLTSVRTSTLTAIDQAGGSPMARIAIAVAMKPVAEGQPAAAPPGLTIAMGESKAAGETLFDVAKGRVERSTVTSDVPMTMGMTGPDGQKVTMQNAVHTVMTFELVPR